MISNVKNDLDAIAAGIRTNEARIAEALETLTAVSADFAAYPTRYAETLAEINGYVPEGAFETLSKDELAKFVAQFSGLVTAVNSAIEAIS